MQNSVFEGRTVILFPDLIHLISILSRQLSSIPSLQAKLHCNSLRSQMVSVLPKHFQDTLCSPWLWKYFSDAAMSKSMLVERLKEAEDRLLTTRQEEVMTILVQTKIKLAQADYANLELTVSPLTNGDSPPIFTWCFPRIANFVPHKSASKIPLMTAWIFKTMIARLSITPGFSVCQFSHWKTFFGWLL